MTGEQATEPDPVDIAEATEHVPDDGPSLELVPLVRSFQSLAQPAVLDIPRPDQEVEVRAAVKDGR